MEPSRSHLFTALLLLLPTPTIHSRPEHLLMALLHTRLGGARLGPNKGWFVPRRPERGEDSSPKVRTPPRVLQSVTLSNPAGAPSENRCQHATVALPGQWDPTIPPHQGETDW
uniref:Uncharacterized protein n=1 Tax=Knipowitschia caucasica TaxID=637954 RepID=A0AAV2L1G1_KNICA